MAGKVLGKAAAKIGKAVKGAKKSAYAGRKAAAKPTKVKKGLY